MRPHALHSGAYASGGSEGVNATGFGRGDDVSVDDWGVCRPLPLGMVLEIKGALPDWRGEKLPDHHLNRKQCTAYTDARGVRAAKLKWFRLRFTNGAEGRLHGFGVKLATGSYYASNSCGRSR